MAQRGTREERPRRRGKTKQTSWTSFGANQFWTGDNNTSNCWSFISHHPRISWFKKSICFALSGSSLSTWSFLIWSETKFLRHNGQFGGRNAPRQLIFGRWWAFAKKINKQKSGEPRKWATQYRSTDEAVHKVKEGKKADEKFLFDYWETKGTRNNTHVLQKMCPQGIVWGDCPDELQV